LRIPKWRLRWIFENIYISDISGVDVLEITVIGIGSSGCGLIFFNGYPVAVGDTSKYMSKNRRK